MIVAIGRAKMINADYVNDKQIVIDVGINDDPDYPGHYCGDVDMKSVKHIVKKLTPVPGGVGSITTAVLCEHTLIACELQNQQNVI